MADTARVVELITTIAADPALRDRLATASDADRTAILAEIGFGDLTPADVAADAAAFMPQVLSEVDQDELNDEALEVVAGGGLPSSTPAAVAAAAAT